MGWFSSPTTTVKHLKPMSASEAYEKSQANHKQKVEREFKEIMDQIELFVDSGHDSVILMRAYRDDTLKRVKELGYRIYIPSHSYHMHVSWGGHASDCAVHNEPALPAGECNCK